MTLVSNFGSHFENKRDPQEAKGKTGKKLAFFGGDFLSLFLFFLVFHGALDLLKRA